MKRAYWLILCFLLLAGAAFWVKPEDLGDSGKIEVEYPYEVDGAWEYPVQPGTTEWVELESTGKRKEACQVPQEALDAMTTEALLETALNYPFCSDMLCFDRTEDGYRHQLMDNSALAALGAREDRHEVTRARLEGMEAWLDEVGPARGEASALQYDCLAIFDQYME